MRRLPLFALLFPIVIFAAGCDCRGAGAGEACATRDDCAAGEACVEGRCAACLDGACTAECTGDEAPCGVDCCAAGEVCREDACVDPATGCASGETPCAEACCAAGTECNAGRCEAPCDGMRCGDARTCCEVGDVCFRGETCCAPEGVCGEACCAAGEVCHGGACRRDCGGGTPGCGPEQACCAEGEVCWLEACVAPGAECLTAGCATRTTESTCGPEEVCDPGLGRCVPGRPNTECVYVPPRGVFDPVPLFTWGVRRERTCADATECQKAERCEGGVCRPTWPHVGPAADDAPAFHQVTSIPMVVDLDADCTPDIVFNSYKDSEFTGNGILRAIRGDDGARVWTLSDPAWRTDSTANPAVGDLDGDGVPEVVVQAEDRETLICVNADGTPRWRSDVFTQTANSGSAAIADLDGRGDAEVIFGSAVFDSSGKLLFEGGAGTGRAGQGPISCVADLDGDGRPELIAGNTVYAFTGRVERGDFAGSVRHQAAGLPEGYCGIGDFDADGDPEIVHIGSGTVSLLDHTLQLLAQRAIPGGGNGGAPNIADFDGDGRPDVGTAGGSNYVVMTFDAPDTLSVLWQAPTEDDSSSRTGSSVFDFDGDGRNEVVYNDEEFVRIYPGLEPDCAQEVPGPGCDGVMTDAEILFKDLNSSRTRTEYPVIADVDGDFKAEIVFATNNEAGFLEPALVGDAGIEVWKDRLDNWVSTRPVWNQHTYHVDNVEVDGRIPATENASWSTHGSYRRNTQGARDYCAPDLVVRDLTWDVAACPEVAASVWVINQGCLGVGPGARVALYEATAGRVAEARTTGALIPGAAEQVTFRYTPSPEASSFELHAVVDDDGTGTGRLNECEEDNNATPPVGGTCMVIW